MAKNLVETVKLVACRLGQEGLTDLAEVLEAALANEHILIDALDMRHLVVMQTSGEWIELVGKARNDIFLESRRRIAPTALARIASYPKDTQTDLIWQHAYAISSDLCYPRDLAELAERVASIKKQLEDVTHA